MYHTFGDIFPFWVAICYFRLYEVIEISVFELAMVGCPWFAVGNNTYM